MFRKPRIIFVTNYCRHYRLPVFEMLSKRHKVSFIFTGDGKRLGWDDYGSLSYTLCRSTLGLMLSLLTARYDVHITNFPIWTSLFEFLAVKVRRRKLIFWCGEWRQPESLIRRIVSPVLRFMAKRSHAIVVYGSPQKAHMLGYGAKQDKILLAPNASVVHIPLLLSSSGLRSPSNE